MQAFSDARLPSYSPTSVNFSSLVFTAGFPVRTILLLSDGWRLAGKLHVPSSLPAPPSPSLLSQVSPPYHTYLTLGQC